MRKPSKKWLECIKVKISILLLLITYPSLVLAQSDIDKSRSAAQGAAGSVYQYLGSGEAINQNAAQPITSSSKQMKTLDGSQSFSAQLSCPSTTKFVDILVQPGGTGDLATVMVTQDTDLDGQIDYQFILPFPVSGICGNGVIQCDPGTWKNCNYWKWVANTQGQLNIQQTDITKMGGCYCVNNSCGNNIVWVSFPLIMKDLGAGATGAIMSTNPKYSITDVKIDDAEISYYSQSLTECGTGGGGGTNPANYYAGGMTDALVSSAAQQEITTQQTDPNSLYSVMSNAIQYHDTLGQAVQCKIIRNITISEAATCPYGNAVLDAGNTICKEQGNNCPGYCNTLNGCTVHLDPIPVSGLWLWVCMFQLWGSGPNISGIGPGAWGVFMTIPGVNATGNAGPIWPAFFMDIRGNGENIEPIQCFNINASDPLFSGNTGPSICATNKEDIVCTSAGEINIPGAYLTTDVADIVKYQPYIDINNMTIIDAYCVNALDWVSASGNTISNGPYAGSINSSTHLWKAYCTYPSTKIDTINESIDDQCLALEQNSNCKAEEEKVDNVYTIKNYTPTGLIPLATCKDFLGYYDHNICRDWWEKERTYLCQNAAKFDLTDAMQRVRSIDKTTKETNGVATYTDYRQDDKTQSWVTEGNTFDLGVAKNQPYDTCSKVCKTRKPKQDSQASQSGVTSQYRKDINTYEFYYRQCYPSTTTCPAGAGEEIIKDCQCINEFAEAFTLLETIKEAGKDSICSSGTKQ